MAISAFARAGAILNNDKYIERELEADSEEDWEDDEIEKEKAEKEILSEMNKFYESLNEKFEKPEIINDQLIKATLYDYTWKDGNMTQINYE